MTKVTLRKKPISGGRQTLYLDYYPPIPHPQTGKLTRREFLGLFLFDEIEHVEQSYLDSTGKAQKRIVPVLDKMSREKRAKLNERERWHNKETEGLAEGIRAQRQLSVQRGHYGFLSEEKQNSGFVDYFEKLAKKRSGSNSDNWQSALHYLRDFTKGAVVRFKDVNEAFCDDFREYLLSAPSRKSKTLKLAQNSALSYFLKFRATLKQAYKEGYLESDLNSRIEGIRAAETERQYLTFEELKKLNQTECPDTVLKRAALFSALTGLRFSDIHKLRWNEVQPDSAGGHVIRFQQRKTKGFETLPISDEAFGLLGEKGAGEKLIFEGLAYSATQSHLPSWLKAAEIVKEITFHSFRHTYATLQLSFGTDLYTVSKMLGHREIKTTQIYAKIIDQQKRQAANKIQLGL